jgi:FMN phosphatase YigB (HAD superfamily)
MQTPVSSADATLPAAPPGGALDARLSDAHALIEQGKVDVLSLDVFDTILWRKVPEPVDAFPLVARRLIERGLLRPSTDPRLFSRLRQAAEWQARTALEDTGGGVEVTLDQIYARFPQFLVAGDSLDALIAAEVEVEREILIPDLDILELIRAAREKGLRVVAVSDTYFTEANLRAFLGRPPAHAWLPDRIFASSAHGVGKGSGLFSIVLRELKVTPDRVVHVGDNPDADVAAARRLGINAVLFERRPKALEELIERETLQLRGIDSRASALCTNDPDLGDFGLAALRSKVLNRAERHAQPARLQPFWDHGATVLGPIFTAFAEWVVLYAQAAGLRQVQCLMREGALLAELVNRAAPALGADVRAETLWLSRQVCARAAIQTGSRWELEALFLRRKQPTLDDFCRTVGLDLAADLPAFADLGRSRLTDGQLGTKVLDTIEENAALQAKIVAGAQAVRGRVVRLAESRVSEGRNELLLVDLGWGGTIQDLLGQVLHSEGTGITLTGLYLLTEQRAADKMILGAALHGFLANGGVPDMPTAAIMRSPEVLEQVCMPDHGTQLDLTDDLEPVLAPEDGWRLQGAERAAVQAGIFAFQRQWARYSAVVPWGLRPLAEAGSLLLPVLARAVTAPTKEEATAFGGWMHDEGFGSADVDRIVTRDSAAAIPYVDPHALTWDLPFQEVYWPYALAALHDEPLAEATALLHAHHGSSDVFAAPLETGPVEFFSDVGWGFNASGMSRVRARTNRRGRSYARAELRADFVKRIRIDPAQGPCIVRIDWIHLRCWPHGEPHPVEHRIAGAEALKGLEIHGASLLRPGLLMVRGRDPQVVVDVETLVGRALWKVDVAVGFAVLPLQPGQARARYDAVKREAASRAKDSPVGRPIGLARKVLRRLVALAR